MASVLTPGHAPSTTPRTWQKAWHALREGARKGADTASAARHRLRRPALVVAGLTCFTASAWHTFGIGAGLLTLGISCWVFEAHTGDDE